jgi:hypothetical protein
VNEIKGRNKVISEKSQYIKKGTWLAMAGCTRQMERYNGHVATPKQVKPD